MKLNTKAARIAARSAVLDGLRAAGAQITEHPDADCIAVFETTARGATIRIYDGTAARPALFEAWRSADKARQRLEEQINNRRERIQRRKDEAGKRTPSEEAQTAAAIRKRLRETFPKVKFSVTCDSFAGGNSVSIHWTDGPITEIVDHITRQYAWGTFDPYTDCSGMREIDPALGCRGAKFVQTSRSYSAERRAEIEAHAAETFGSVDVLKDQWGDFYHARYERQHPDLWDDCYRNIYECQQEEQAEAQRLAWEQQQAEEAAEAARRAERRESMHRLARLTALATLETDAATSKWLEAQCLGLIKRFPGAVTQQEIVRMVCEVYQPMLKQRGAPRHFSAAERAAFLAMDEGAENIADGFPVPLEALPGILAAANVAKPSNVINIADFR